MLTRNIRDIKSSDNTILQKYCAKPHLIEGYKYDFRLYVLVMGVNPLRIYLFRDGMVRKAEKYYDKPNDKNMKRLLVHIASKETPFDPDLEDETYKPPKKLTYRDALKYVEHEYGVRRKWMLEDALEETIIKLF